MNYKELNLWIMFSEYSKLSNHKKIELLKKYKNIKDIANLLEFKENIKIYNYIEYMNRNNIKILKYLDEKYPNDFRYLYDAPIIIYALGNIDILNTKSKIAVIGARKASNYGINVAQKIGTFLSNNNIHTVSGLALGIDMNSHIGVLKENINNVNSGKAIAVIGNGLDNIYPYSNQNIAKKILYNGGCIITEYIVGTKPLKMNFPARNRLISALSNKLIVVEAESEKSGTMITVDYSLELGRDILVVPGNITSKMSLGTNKLIKEGAKVITEFNDIIDEEY